MIVTAIPYEAVDDLWPVVEPWMDDAAKISKGMYGVEDIKAGLDDRTLALWIVYDGQVPVAAFTTRVFDTPGLRVLAMDWVGGTRMKDWLGQALEILERYGRDMGCKRLEGGGRIGWEKALAEYGWKRKPGVMKELTDG